MDYCNIPMTEQPAHIPLPIREEVQTLTIAVSNTTTNACAATKYFDRQNFADANPYHKKMTLWEHDEPGGGLLGSLSPFSRSIK